MVDLLCQMAKMTPEESVAMKIDNHTGETYDMVQNKLTTESIVRALVPVGGSLEHLQYLPNLKTCTRETPPVLYKCGTCTKTFTTKSGLKFHEKHAHTEGKLYCLICKKPFKLSNDLERHMNIHTGKRPFKCSSCDKAFVCKSSLNQHEKLKHFVGDIYKCENCDKTFNTEADVIRHRRVHTGVKPFECDKCEKSFTCKSSLNVHKRTHDGKTFSCSLCKMQFYVQSDLKRHETVHTGEKPFKCDLCRNSYSCKSSYKFHLRKSHGCGSPVKILKSSPDKKRSPQRVKMNFIIKCSPVKEEDTLSTDTIVSAEEIQGTSNFDTEEYDV